MLKTIPTFSQKMLFCYLKKDNFSAFFLQLLLLSSKLVLILRIYDTRIERIKYQAKLNSILKFSKSQIVHQRMGFCSIKSRKAESFPFFANFLALDFPVYHSATNLTMAITTKTAVQISPVAAKSAIFLISYRAKTQFRSFLKFAFCLSNQLYFYGVNLERCGYEN